MKTVKLIKIFIWPIILCFIVWGCFFIISIPDDIVDNTLLENSAVSSDYTLKRTSIDGWKENAHTWSLNAEIVKTSIGSSIHYLLDIYDGTIFRQGSSPLKFSSESGTYYEDRAQLVLDGDVCILSDEDFVLNASKVMWYDENSFLQIPDKLRVSFEKYNIVANYMESYINDDMCRLKGDIVVQAEGAYKIETQEMTFNFENGSFETKGDTIVTVYLNN